MKKIFIVLFSLNLIACSSGNCRSQREKQPMDEKKAQAAAAAAEAVPVANSTQNRIKVFKYDGSLQCGMGKATPIGDMAKELAGITIYSSENKADGLMHIQLCGSPTGRANVYEIDQGQLEAAKKKGFKEWTFD